MSPQPEIERSAKGNGGSSQSQDGWSILGFCPLFGWSFISVSTSPANMVKQEAATGCSSQSHRQSRAFEFGQLSLRRPPPHKTEGRERFAIVCQSHMLASTVT